jgi:hypothetical protein
MTRENDQHCRTTRHASKIRHLASNQNVYDVVSMAIARKLINVKYDITIWHGMCRVYLTCVLHLE